MAALWLGDAVSVADIGCGTMALRDFLRPTTRYIAIDIAKRDEKTIVVDLDRSRIPDTGAEAAAVLGVIEYLECVDTFLSQLKNFSFCVISYNHKSLKDLAWAIHLKKNDVTWINHLTSREFNRKIAAAGLKIVRSKTIRMGEVLYYLVPQSS